MRITNWLWRSAGLARRNHPGRYTLLLFTILLLLVSQPFFVAHSDFQMLATLLMIFVLLAALYTLNLGKVFFVIGLTIMAVAALSRLILQFTHSRSFEVITAVSSSLFLMITVFAVVSRLFTVKRVTLDTISAAICAYLLMALAWGFGFALVEIEHPGSFSVKLLTAAAPGASTVIETLHNFIYYSFVCLTTTGYGDIAPISDGARIMSVLESVTGQLYLTILVARLVSIEVAQSMMEGRVSSRDE